MSYKRWARAAAAAARAAWARAKRKAHTRAAAIAVEGWMRKYFGDEGRDWRWARVGEEMGYENVLDAGAAADVFETEAPESHVIYYVELLKEEYDLELRVPD